MAEKAVRYFVHSKYIRWPLRMCMRSGEVKKDIRLVRCISFTETDASNLFSVLLHACAISCEQPSYYTLLYHHTMVPMVICVSIPVLLNSILELKFCQKFA